MARSPFTLAAAVTAAIPGAQVTGARALTAGGDGRFDSAVATLATGDEAVIRVADDDGGARELASEALALRALTAGARAMLPFRVPAYLGETRVGDGRGLVTEFLPGFQVDAAHIPSGPGAAQAAGAAIAAVHALPVSVVRAAGLPDRPAATARADLRTLVDRAAATGSVPARLIVRWRGAIDDDVLWQFESTVTLGGASATTFLYEDDPAAGPVVVGVIGWHGLSIGDPSVDFAWLSSAPDAAADVRLAYAEAAARTPDDAIATRGRLRAELEFARWLLHGEEMHDDAIVKDASALLEALSESIRENDLVEIAARGDAADAALQSALGAAERVPTSAAGAVDTSMQTDTYTPEELWIASGNRQNTGDPQDAGDPQGTRDPQATRQSQTGSPDLSRYEAALQETQPDGVQPIDPNATQPIDAGFFTPDVSSEAGSGSSAGDADEAQRAARAALQRWTSSSSE